MLLLIMLFRLPRPLSALLWHLCCLLLLCPLLSRGGCLKIVAPLPLLSDGLRSHWVLSMCARRLLRPSAPPCCLAVQLSATQRQTPAAGLLRCCLTADAPPF